MSLTKLEVSSAQSKWDIRVSSPRKLFRALHDFLDERGYEHAYEPLRAERDAINDTAIFNTELIGRRDCRERNRFKLILGVSLFFTIVLIPLAMHLTKASRYSIRTIARIGVEGESYRTKLRAQGITQREELDVVSDARVTFNAKTGVVETGYGMLKPAKGKRELKRVEEEQRELECGFAEVMFTMSLPDVETP